MLVIFETLAVALAGACIFKLLHAPLPWMLGALFAVLLWSGKRQKRLKCPLFLYGSGMTVVGYTMGRTFTNETVREMITQLPAMLLVTLGTVVFSLFLGYLIHRKTDISLATGLIGSIPGGLSQVAALCAEIKDTDLAAVTFMQTARLLSVIFVVPFLAIHILSSGSVDASNVAVTQSSIPSWHNSYIYMALLVAVSGYIAKKIHLPTPYLLGAVLMTAGLVLSGLTAPALPPVVISMAQVLIGAYTGARMDMEGLKRCKQLIPFTLVSVVSLLLLSLGIGWLLQSWHGISFISAFLSTAPGGMAEMSLTALQLRADITVLVAFQLFRLLFILLVVPPVLKWWLRRKKETIPLPE